MRPNERMQPTEAEGQAIFMSALAKKKGTHVSAEMLRNVPLAVAVLDDYKLHGTGIIGQCHYDIFPEISDRWKSVHQRSLRGEILGSPCESFARREGQTQWLRWSVFPWRDDDHVIRSVIIITEDLTALKDAEERSQLESCLNRSILSGVAEAVIAVDRDGIMVTWKGGAEGIFGVPEPDALGKPLALLAPELQGLERCFRDGGANHAAPVPGVPATRRVDIRRSDGLAMPAELKYSLVVTNDYAVTVCVVRDLREETRAAEEHLARVSAEAASKAKSQFLASMSHEIRTPMDGIIATLDLAMNTPMTPEQMRYLTIASDSDQRLLKLVNGLVDPQLLNRAELRPSAIALTCKVLSTISSASCAGLRSQRALSSVS